MNEFEEGLRAEFRVTDSVTKDGVLLARAEAVESLVGSNRFEQYMLAFRPEFPPDLEKVAERMFMVLLEGVKRPDETGTLQVELCTLSERLKDAGALAKHPEIEGLNLAGRDLVFTRLLHRFEALTALIGHIDNGE